MMSFDDPTELSAELRDRYAVLGEFCGNCRYAINVDGDSIRGLRCRRFPPQMIVLHRPDEIQVVSQHPGVKQDDWCGEHKHKEQTQ